MNLVTAGKVPGTEEALGCCQQVLPSTHSGGEKEVDPGLPEQTTCQLSFYRGAAPHTVSLSQVGYKGLARVFLLIEIHWDQHQVRRR